jgi:hypothetical protein
VTELSDETRRLVEKLFDREDQVLAARLLEEQCGSNLPLLGDADKYRLERFRYAALKLSGGQLGELQRAIAVAQQDWRDLLVAAGFGNSLEAHKRWAAEVQASSMRK